MENLESLTPLIKSIQESESEQLYLRSLDRFVEEKESEIEKICETNYEVWIVLLAWHPSADLDDRTLCRPS